jgi:hypothetical protein
MAAENELNVPIAEAAVKIEAILSATDNSVELAAPVYDSAATPAGDKKPKMEIATAIFKQMTKIKGVTRKEIIDRFVAEAKLSKAGASTYYQLIRTKEGK